MSVTRRNLIKFAAPAALLLPVAGIANSNNKTNDVENKLDVFIIYGQSNALGFAGLDDGFIESNLVKINSGSYYYFGGEIRPLVHYMPSVNTGVSSGSAWSQFSNTYKQLTGRSCLFVQCARGSTFIEYLIPGTNNYERMVSASRDAVSIIGSEKLGKIYCLYHQGEADQLLETKKEKYKEMLLSLGKGMKSDLGIDKFFVFKVAAPHGRKEECVTAIQSAQDEVCETEELFVMAYSGCPSFNIKNLLLGSDGTHYSIFGYNVMGQIGAENVAKNIDTKTTVTKDDIEKYGVLSLNPKYDWKMASASFTFNGEELKILTNLYPEHGNDLYATSNILGFDMDNKTLKVIPSFKVKNILSAQASFNHFDSSVIAKALIKCVKDSYFRISSLCDISFDIIVGDNTSYRPFSYEEFAEIDGLVTISNNEKTREIIVNHPSSGMLPNILISTQGKYDKSLGHEIKILNKNSFSIKYYLKSYGTRMCISISNCEIPIKQLKFKDMILSVQVIAA